MQRLAMSDENVHRKFVTFTDQCRNVKVCSSRYGQEGIITRYQMNLWTSLSNWLNFEHSGTIK